MERERERNGGGGERRSAGRERGRERGRGGDGDGGGDTRRRTSDGGGDGNRDGSEDSSGDGNGDEDNGNMMNGRGALRFQVGIPCIQTMGRNHRCSVRRGTPLRDTFERRVLGWSWKRVQVWQELGAHTSRCRGQTGAKTIPSGYTVAGSDRGLPGSRLVDKTSADSRSIGSYLGLSERAKARGTERLHALAAFMELPTPLA